MGVLIKKHGETHMKFFSLFQEANKPVEIKTTEDRLLVLYQELSDFNKIEADLVEEARTGNTRADFSLVKHSCEWHQREIGRQIKAIKDNADDQRHTILGKRKRGM